MAEDYSFDDAAITVGKLIETISTKPVHLIRISFGSFIAQVTTLARPDLVRSLTLIGAASHFPEEVRKGMKFRAEAVRAGGMSAVLQSSSERWFTPNTDVHGRLGEFVVLPEHEPSTPQSVAYGLAEAIRGAKIAVIPDASHIVTVEAPAAVNDALRRFLNGLADRLHKSQ